MDMQTLTSSMKNLIEKLTLVQADNCTDEFLKILENLIDVSTSIQLKRLEVTPLRKRRHTNASSSSDEVRIVSNEIVTVDLDSDSNHSQESSHVSVISTPPKSNVLDVDGRSAQEVHVDKGHIESNEHNMNAVCKKRCTVKLHRIDMAQWSSLSTVIHANNQNSIERIKPIDGIGSAALTQMENQNISGQVRLTENENNSHQNLQPSTEHFTYEDSRKLYRDVCCMQ